jgi:FIMAH domain-containing protein
MTNATVLSSPFQWGSSDQMGEARLLGWSARVGNEVRPGGSASGFVMRANGLPGITDCYVVGDVPIVQLSAYPKYSAPEAVRGSSVVENSVHLRTIGPVQVPSNFEPAQFLQTIIGYKEQAIRQGWIKDQAIGNSLDAKLNTANAALAGGDNKMATNILNALLNEVDAQAGKQLSSEAVALLKINTQYLISKIR